MINSKKSVFALLYGLIATSFVLLVLYGLIFADIPSPGISDIIGLILGFPLIIISILVILRTRVSVDKTHVRMNTLFRQQLCSWQDITKISVPYGLGYIPFRGYQIQLTKVNNTILVLPIHIFSNRKKLSKAIIEAGFAVNPAIEISNLLLDKFGNPPYGIFEK